MIFKYALYRIQKQMVETVPGSLLQKISCIQTKVAQALPSIKPSFTIFLLVFSYLQILTFSFDKFSTHWFGTNLMIFGYLDLSTYLADVTIYLMVGVSMVYVMMYWLMILMIGLSERVPLLIPINKVLLMLFSSILFNGVIGHLSLSLTRDSMVEKIVGSIAMGLFFLTLCFESFLFFTFLRNPKQPQITKESNYSALTFLCLFLVSILKDRIFPGEEEDEMRVKLIIFNVCLLLHGIVCVLKNEHREVYVFKIQLYCILINIIAVIMVDIMVFLSIRLRISLWLVLIFIAFLCVRYIQLFRMSYLLQNINKWNNSQSVIQYTKELRNLLYDRLQDEEINYHPEILVYGYIEIHKQKCQEPTCPSRKVDLGQEPTQLKNQEVIRTEQLIKTIYTMGLKMTPINPQVQIEYAIFLYELGMKEKALKIILQIEENDLTVLNYYKTYKMKKQIHQQMCQEPNQKFLNLLSQLHLTNLQEQIFKKFQQAALTNLQFWSVLNEDHPDFQKLNQIGANRVKVSEQIQELYEEISKLAFSQRITDLFVFYLCFIENDQQLYNQVYRNLKDDYQLNQKILIENWNNTSEPIMLISIEDHNYGDIIDINSTCALVFGYEKYELMNKNYTQLFPQKIRQLQSEQFISLQGEKTTLFFTEHKNNYLLKLRRETKVYSSMETGLTVFTTLMPQNTYNLCFLLFEKERLIGMSSGCITMLGIDKNIIEDYIRYDELVSIKKDIIPEEKQPYPLYKVLILSEDFQEKSQEIFYLQKTENGDLLMLELTPIRNKKIQTISEDELYFYAGSFGFYYQEHFECYSIIGENLRRELQRNDFVFVQNYTKSMDRSQTTKNYGEGIATLRLHENYIKIIEESEQSENKQNQDGSQTTNNQLLIGEKIGTSDEDAIFQSRKSYHQFLLSHHTRNYLKCIIVLGILIIFGVYFAYFYVSIQKVEDMTTDYTRISDENVAIGLIARIQCLVYRWEQQSLGISSQSLDETYHQLEESAEDLQLLKEKFISSEPVIVTINNNQQNKTFLTDEFVLAYANYADMFLSYFHSNQTTQEVRNAFLSIKPEIKNYILINGQFTKKQMEKKELKLVEDCRQKSENNVKENIIMACGGMALAIVFGIILMCFISHFNKEKVDNLSAFLNVTEHQIQYFSSKTQKFLITLHSEESADDFDDGQKAINLKKKESSGYFYRKKRFKVIEFGKGIYLRMLVIPILCSSFFIYCLVLNHQHFNFMRSSLRYSYLQSNAMNVFYTGLSQMNQQILSPTNTDITTQINAQYLQYYREYFYEHYDTFGFIEQFHEKFAFVFMYDICEGPVYILHACELSGLVRNGSLLLFSDVTVSIERNTNLSRDFSRDFYLSVEVIMHVHEYLIEQNVQILGKITQNIKNTLLIVFVVFSTLLMVVVGVYGLLVENEFNKELQINKKMLMFFPASMARSLPQVNAYIKKILNNKE